jgi:hypothetical protein
MYGNIDEMELGLDTYVRINDVARDIKHSMIYARTSTTLLLHILVAVFASLFRFIVDKPTRTSA